MPPMKKILCLVVALLTLFTLPAIASEAEIRQALKARFPNVRVDGVQPAPLAGLFEVRFQAQDGPQILYTDARAKFFVVEGSIIDAKSGRNLTEERLQKLSAIEFSALPLEIAVKVQRGNGKRVLAMFSDPYCPACQQFERELVQVEDITIYYFMYPVIRPDLAEHSRAVWCAADRAKAWLDLALRGKPSATAANCDAPMEKLIELGRSLRVNSTPTLYFANGERLRGGLPLAQLRAKLDEIARQPAKKN